MTRSGDTARDPNRADVLVIGAGPAGATAACLIAEDGWNVLVLEREQFPRDHIGESLIPAVVPVLKRLGVKRTLDETGVIRKRGTTFRWGSDPEPWTVHFVESNPRLGYSYQVWRPDFDQVLVDRAREKGATVEHGFAVDHVDHDSAGRIIGVTGTDAEGVRRSVRAHLVVDASGQSAVTARHLARREFEPSLRHVAVYGYFENSGSLPGVDATNTLTEGYDEGWIWHIPLNTGLVSVGTVVNADDPQLRTLPPEAFLAERISRTGTARGLLEKARLARGPFTCRDWSYDTETSTGPGFLAVGDAARFIDPLFSTGVYLAMQHAVSAAACVNSVLRGDVDETRAMEFFDRNYKEDFSDLREIVLIMYASVEKPRDSLFWNARRILAMPDSEPARRAFVRLISGRERLGFRLNPLAPLDLPDDWRAALSEFEGELRQQLPLLAGSGVAAEAHPFMNSVLTVSGTGVFERHLMVVNDEWTEEPVCLVDGYMAKSARDPRGHPKEAKYVDSTVALLDGKRTVREVCSLALQEAAATGVSLSRKGVVDALANMYWHGVLVACPQDAHA